MIPTQKEVQEAYNRASKEVKDFISNDTLNNFFNKTRNDYKMHLDDAEKYSLVLTGTVLGIIPFDSFENELKNALPNISKDALAEILQKTNEDIFRKLRKTTLQKNKPVNSPQPVAEKKNKIEEQAQPSVSKLEEVVQKEAVDVVMETPQEPVEPETKKYPSSDPYREPID